MQNSSEPIYTLSIASKLSNTPLHSIRQYIDRGLLIPYKTETNRHLFSDDDIHRLIWIGRQLREEGLNFAGIKMLYSLIPCWKLKSCSVEDREKCKAYNNVNTSCWEASEKGLKCRNEDCRNCDVYSLSGAEFDIKSILRELLP